MNVSVKLQHATMKNSALLKVLIVFSLVLLCRWSGFSQSTKESGKQTGSEGDKKKEETVYSATSELGESDNQPVIEEAKAQLVSMSTATGELGEFCKKFGIKGHFIIDITLQGKGKVVTVFMVSSNVEVKDQNSLKNKLSGLQFSNIKIPKNKRVKFRYTLTI